MAAQGLQHAYEGGMNGFNVGWLEEMFFVFAMADNAIFFLLQVEIEIEVADTQFIGEVAGGKIAEGVHFAPVSVGHVEKYFAQCLKRKVEIEEDTLEGVKGEFKSLEGISGDASYVEGGRLEGIYVLAHQYGIDHKSDGILQVCVVAHGHIDPKDGIGAAAEAVYEGCEAKLEHGKKGGFRVGSHLKHGLVECLGDHKAVRGAFVHFDFADDAEEQVLLFWGHGFEFGADLATEAFPIGGGRIGVFGKDKTKVVLGEGLGHVPVPVVPECLADILCQHLPVPMRVIFELDRQGGQRRRFALKLRLVEQHQFFSDEVIGPSIGQYMMQVHQKNGASRQFHNFDVKKRSLFEVKKMGTGFFDQIFQTGLIGQV